MVVLILSLALGDAPRGPVQAPRPIAMVPYLAQDSMLRTGVLDGTPPAADFFQSQVLCTGLPSGTYDVGVVIQSGTHPGGALVHFATVTIGAGAVLSVSGYGETPADFGLEPAGIYYATPLVYSAGTGALAGARTKEQTQRVAPVRK